MDKLSYNNLKVCPLSAACAFFSFFYILLCHYVAKSELDEQENPELCFSEYVPGDSWEGKKLEYVKRQWH